MQLREKSFLLIVFLLALANVFVWWEVFALGGEIGIVFFDVGQGDSIFIETSEGHQILIDGGPGGKKILEKLSREMPFWDKTIDLVILTHPDYDHLNGLNYVLQRYRVENILWTGVRKETKTFEHWLDNLEKEKEEGAEIFIAQKGQKITAGRAVFYILHPFESLKENFLEGATDDTSVVAKLLFGKNSFLFTGDITEKTERELLVRSDMPVGLPAELLKVAHHGSKSSISKQFLQMVNPEIAIISVGANNPYGHPHQEVLSRLQELNIEILRTDEAGDIKLISNGSKFEYSR